MTVTSVGGAAGVAVRFDITLAGVSRTFVQKRGRFFAIKDLDLTIEDGSFVSVIGPSGCGKSTLLRLIGGLIDPDEGRITVGDEMPIEARENKQFGFVPQEPALLPWRNVIENVGLLGELNRRASGTQAHPADPETLLRAVGLGDFIHSLPRELSGGMKQRVSLVRAFSLGAPVMLMDEPFAALDEFTRAGMRFQLLDLWERTGNTVVFITHNIDEAVTLSDRVVVMSPRPGRIVTEAKIDLPRPRREAMEDTDEFYEYVQRIKSALRSSWAE